MARARHLPAKTLRTREEFIARERKAWSELKRLWARLPEAALLRPGANGEASSAKDIFNHVAAWQEAALRVIPSLHAGRWGRLGPNTDKFNAINYAADQARPLAESRQRLNRSRRALLTLLGTVTDEQLLNKSGRQQIGWWAKWTTHGHYEQHVEDLQRFREQVGLAGA